MKKQTIKLNEENIHSEHWDNKIDMLLRTLQYLKDHLENGLFVVDGFVGGQRMEAINRIGLCCMALNDILDKGGITLTDKSVPVASPYKLNESQLRNIIKESIKNILRESAEDEALNFVQSVNLDELIQNGKTYTEYGEGFYISRSSNRRDAILELTINGDNGYGHARVGLAGDLEEDYQYALSLAYEDYLTSNQPS